ncbi:MAG: carboxy terminal-processing peptidase [Planctomycetota bacterium]|nr:carboxy terminal-processing peptidase [Planctomycetota bacterium]
MKFRNPSRAAIALTCGMLVLAATTFSAQQLIKAANSDSVTAQMVCKLVVAKHISRSKINDDISARLLKRFLETLDPQKYYFTQDDVDTFSKQKLTLDDSLLEGNVDFAYEVFDLYLKRLDARMKLAAELIDADHDFTIDEEMLFNGKDLAWSKSDKEIRERWRMRIKYDLLTKKLEDADMAEARKQLHKRYYNIRRMMHQTEDFEKLEMYLSSLTHCFDPHSSYMSPQTLEDFRIIMAQQLEGIGAALRSEDGFTRVVSIVKGGAAEKDGRLKVDDKIVGVDKGDGELVDVIEMKLSRVVRLIRGAKGTKVRLQVKKPAGKLEIYELTRQNIELTSSRVKYKIIDAGKRIDGTNGRIAVINIPSFYRDFAGAQRGLPNFTSTARDVKQALTDIDTEGGADSYVIDLRSNGGGALSEAIEVSGLFIKDGPVVQIKEPNGSVRSHNDEDGGFIATDKPLVVLCSRMSASASEIFAGVIKDYRRGIIVGDQTTHGKGTVQNVMPVSQRLIPFRPPENRGALKLTINQFYRVNGDSTQNKGVESDVVLPSLVDHMDIGESSLDNALPFDQIKKADFQALGLVDAKVVAALQQSSSKRVKADKEFMEAQGAIDRYVARKDRKTVSLNEATLRKEREADKNLEKDDPEKLADPENEDIFPDGSYNDEILRITLDYGDLLKNQKTAGN